MVGRWKMESERGEGKCAKVNKEIFSGVPLPQPRDIPPAEPKPPKAVAVTFSAPVNPSGESSAGIGIPSAIYMQE